MVEAWGKLTSSLLQSDWLISLAALIEFGFFIVLCAKLRWFKDSKVKITSIVYTLFLTTLSCFPLLGMLGTVMGLLGLDLASGDMENIKNNFFIALTSTAWGIIFSLIFKFGNAFIADRIEVVINKEKQEYSK
ncbi:MotA/TolQ/ExbB proton channel family protein [[Clostridium] aminophilum]|uniref:MotA/TolQ/ExbB proton channel family protein n=1 Tax=[Clostridium] aminophilum TaxID=1526 RepID=A0A1I0AXW8_9FIRM|nr:MotA/TolQ/ExbB proton channel family protein [[Clostridium] aminophilum]SES98861.1 MotA/TolQ/ExbB proton channel family protein [[Clostridium] aminophilum]